MNEKKYTFTAEITLNIKDNVYAFSDEEAEEMIDDRIDDFIKATIDNDCCITDGHCYNSEIL